MALTTSRAGGWFASKTNLADIHVGSQTDHGQSQPDYPHARSHMQAWLDEGHGFVRLNADAVYLALLSGKDADEFPDNDANTVPPYPNTANWMVPEKVAGTQVDVWAIPAALLELIDRTHTQNTEVNLSAVLTP